MEICNVPSLLWSLRRIVFLFSFFIFFLTPSIFSTLQLSHRRHPHPRLGNASDQEALLGFLSAITYDPSPSLTTWNPNVSFCEWTGIICSRHRQRVVSLNVSSMELQGTVSPLLGNLSFLKILDLSNNNFHGHIPYRLGNLFRLKMLRMSLNELQGSIPPSLGGCRSLSKLILSYNNLSGSIPSELCVLPNLEFIYLGINNLTGTIPACLGNMSSLDIIDLSSNSFHGSIPSELGMLSQLSSISLSANLLTGEIPSYFSNFTNLGVLALTANQLTGHIPVDLCRKNMRLTGLYLGSNQLNGSIPASLFNCTNLHSIYLSYNQFGGIVPMELGKLMQLQFLYLDANQLVSSSNGTTNLPILTVLTNCSTLKSLDLSQNHLTGRLPFSIGCLSRELEILNLGTNELAAEIPPGIGNLSSLTFRLPFSIGCLSRELEILNLGTNELAAEIPPGIGNLSSLTFLSLEANSFTGAIPATLKMLQKLERLIMGGNNLQGNIPAEIGQLKSLGLLDINENNLSGRIPDSIASLQQLRYLYLHMNQLSGKIPTNLGKCVNLLLLDLSYNKLSGQIPPEVAGLANLAFYFNLSNNLLEGPLPLELSKMTMLQAIDISANQLIGNIPSALGSCNELEYINLSCNALQGLIPISLGELQSLQDMDLSSNNLSGGIPMSLANLKMLRQLNFSFNNLSGKVPKGGVFKNLSATSFMGNHGLYGPWVSISPFSAHKPRSVSNMKRVIMLIVAVAVTVVSFLFLGILWRQNHKRHILIEVRTSLNVGHRRISYGELIIATEEFSDANLLGVGSFGKVYKGVMNDGTIVAVKLLNLENGGAHKSFQRECKVLSRVRHRNLIKIITSYSDHQIKALIFPFMPNGSLEKWLYPDGEVESGLTLIQRLNIAIDIAQGMVYLHHHCFMQVIHCDLKPNNVLLGEDMTAYLIDFGIATICFASSEDSISTSTLALKGSIGYIPPEYGLGGHVTTKGDVYSYGIVLLEMLTGKKPTNNMFVEGMNLQKWVGSSFPNQLEEVVDKSLLRRTSTSTQVDNDLNCLSQSITMGLLCTKDAFRERPTMMDIVGTLQSIRDTFLGVVTFPKSKSNFTCLLSDASTSHNNPSEGQSSSTG